MRHVTLRALWTDDVEDGRVDARRLDRVVGGVGEVRFEENADGSELVALVGVGARHDASPEGLRRAARAAARRLSIAFPIADGANIPGIDVDMSSFTSLVPPEATSAALAEGLAFGGYSFRMTGEHTWESRIFPAVAGPASDHEGWMRGTAIGLATSRARDLVNAPASALTPLKLAAWTEQLLVPLGVRVEVRGEKELREEGFGGITAIGRGSPNPPVLLELTIGAGQPECVFVGKGVTYDSGGLSLKGAEALMSMKSDMAGSAAVISAFALLPQLAPGRSFAAVVPIVENMPGPGAIRPGDVTVLRDGSTLEILNTDFEGRVILADALARAAELQPQTIIDLASLTYAAQHALGESYAALVSTDDALAAALMEAGARAGERLWRMPLQPELDAQIRSDVADYKNFPGATNARVSTAGLLLSKFVGNIPWAHIDMAGPCFRASAAPDGAAGGTGFGVALLTEFVGSDLA